MTGWTDSPEGFSQDDREAYRRQPEDFTDDQRAAMFPGGVEHFLRGTAEREVVRRELDAHPSETIPEIAARVARELGGGFSRARLSRVVGLVIYHGRLWDASPGDKQRWLDEAERLLEADQ